MPLSQDTQNRIIESLTSRTAGAEVIAALSTTLGSPAAAQALISGVTPIPASACAGVATPSATNVNGAIDTCNAVVTTRLTNIEAKLNAVITALKGAALMAP